MEWMLMPLRRYADFSGRSRRMEYWMWVLFQFLIGIGFGVLMVVVGGSAAAMSTNPAQGLVAASGAVLVLYLLYLLVALVFLVPNIAVTVRRLHDTNRSGWWLLGFWIPYFFILYASFSSAMAGAKTGMSPQTPMLLGIVSLIWLVFCLVLLVFMFLEGTRGPNKYGPDPKAPDPGAVFA